MNNEAIKFLKKNNIIIKKTEILNQGISNENYLINSTYVLKIPFDVNFSRVDKDVIDFQNRNSKLFISPRIIDYDVNNGFILTEYFSLFKPINVKKINLKQVENIVAIIKKYHALNPLNLKKLNYVDLLDSFRLMLKPKERIYCSSLEYSPLFLKPYEPSHFDLVDNNILCSSDYEIKLIDYEFACLAPRFFDLISLLGENHFKREIMKRIIDLYFGKNLELKAEFYIEHNELLAIADLLWYHWAMARSKSTDKNRAKVFLKIAEEKRSSLFSYISKENLKRTVKLN